MAEDKERDNEARTEALRAELDEMCGAYNAPSVAIPAAAWAGILARKYVELANAYWSLRLDGELSTIVGDHQQAQVEFKQGRRIMQRLSHLRDRVAEESEAVKDIYQTLVDDWKTERHNQQAQERAEKKRSIARAA